MNNKIESPQLEFVSIASNPVSNSADWGEIFAYAGSNLVVLYDPKTNQNTKTLRGHKNRVNCVRWVSESMIVSSDADGKVLLWNHVHDDKYTSSLLTKHKRSVNNIDVHHYGGTVGTLIATTAADGTVGISQFNVKDASNKVIQTIDIGNNMMEAIALTKLPNTEETIPVLVMGGVDSRIHVYVMHGDQFQKYCALTGHENWIRDIEPIILDDGTILIATASQDNRVRVWRFSRRQETAPSNTDALEYDIYSLTHSAQRLEVSKDQSYTIELETILIGHEDWVHCVRWHPRVNGKQPIKLLTCSMDRSMVLWGPTDSNVWEELARMGQFGGLNGMTGQMGYFGAYFSPTGEDILAHGYHGSFHLWHRKDESHWVPLPTISGHFQPVNDAMWAPNSDYFITTSLDQTTRLWARWMTSSAKHWHEMGRPQIHGYDMKCLTFIPGDEHRLVSAGDEKVIRVFDAPTSALANLKALSNIGFDASRPRASVAVIEPKSLSNKAISNDEQVSLWNNPPLEDQLLSNSLWPEIQKLYGHPNEMMCVTSNHAGTLLASACHAKKEQFAHVRLWSTSSWSEHQPAIPGHKNTVTRIAFSPDDRLLVSVSRDRSIIVYRLSDETGQYLPCFRQPAHDRIIWDICVTQLTLENNVTRYLFLSVSRDKSFKLWALDIDGTSEFPSSLTLLFKHKFKGALTACGVYGQHLFAFGFESGAIALWSLSSDCSDFSQVSKVPLLSSHAASVNRLQFHLLDDHLRLLSVSSDHSIRLFRLPSSLQ